MPRASSTVTLRISFRELSERVTESAKAFLASGIEKGDRVAIWAPNCAEWILAALGAQVAGAAVVPLNTRFKGAEAAYVVNRSGARILCCVNGFLGNDYVSAIRDCGEDLPTVERIVVLKGDAPEGTTSWTDFLGLGTGVDDAAVAAREATVTEDDLSDIIFTSGTRGSPRA